MNQEKVLLQTSEALVSTSRVVIAGKTYSTANITSVTKRFTPASSGCAITLLVVGALGMLLGLGMMTSKSFGAGLGQLIVAGAVAAGGYFWFRSLKPTYHVVLSSASGEGTALSSKDGAAIDAIVNAISQALIERG
ncbi:MAG: hypothetical protein IPJ17_17960 [Holophagales bacterium]|nr:MAG: hypothetical protein IPJ17_17960 [Holophagales bacterium]